jgi:signal transduction histidine kinase/DNA-binding response OmpR family regulator
MEEEVIRSINSNAETADRLAMRTYGWLAMFALLGTLLVILVLVVVVRYTRKMRDYQQALIRSKEETEELARTKEIFVANMSHEIRTPVNAIHGFTEQLLYRSFDEKSRELIDIIKSSSDHLVRLVNDILDFSRLQNATIVLEKSHFQIRKVCEEIQLLFGGAAAKNDTRLSYMIGKSTPLILYGDSYRLKQILINLIGNAVKFTTHGEIHFSVDCVMKTENSLDLVLKVADNGIGISEAMQEKVFDDFVQAETSTYRKYGGTGLGLSIVKKLVELHQGDITLKSRENEGTTVICVLPYEVGNWEQLPLIARELYVPEKIGKLKLLVVDDEEYNRMLFRTILNRWGTSFDEAGDGLKALEMIRSSHYDLVFMDVRMPLLDGLQVTARIRNELGKSETELPVIGISATHTSEDLLEFRHSGMNAFLPKPFTEKMLLEIIMAQTAPVRDPSGMNEMNTTETLIPDDTRVDLSNLYHLADQDISFVRQMLTQFMESTRQGLEEIHQAVETGNADGVMETAHKISSPCRHLGADGLYNKLKAIEEEARNHKNMAILARLSEKSRQEFSEIECILQEHIVKISE